MRRLAILSLSLLASAASLTSTAQSAANQGPATNASAAQGPATNAPETNAAHQVKVANGILEGVTEASGVRSYKGIPFAAPPVGKLRWREPQPAANWQGVRKADHFAAKAMQLPIYDDMQFRASGTSEDCLYLNVWQPFDAGAGKKLVPVLVYFYGGGYVAGDGSEYRYDGESMEIGRASWRERV